LRTNPEFASATKGAAAPNFGADDYDCLPIAPLLAGARARGLADAFDMLGVAAILIDADGDVLFANAGAQALFGAHLTVSGERLTAGREGDQRALRRLMDAALTGARRSSELTIQRGTGLAALRLRATPVSSADEDPFQLLRAVVILDQTSGHSAR
jgi:PAS domain-containing protein